MEAKQWLTLHRKEQCPMQFQEEAAQIINKQAEALQDILANVGRDTTSTQWIEKRCEQGLKDECPQAELLKAKDAEVLDIAADMTEVENRLIVLRSRVRALAPEVTT